ncbi:unnamed protein product [Acanthoscelides obtectus]|uniref:Kinesin-like protein n=2 Tax=Acanthoscelides obtectus TaxID=200917 RepID=A0A9P0PCE3_ACAOB|nr:unnamed protein product [Acanthoscelides obtectus]CAK1621018.1 Kinesin-like protein KIF18A [Acanthoscelides obtectus]
MVIPKGKVAVSVKMGKSTKTVRDVPKQKTPRRLALTKSRINAITEVIAKPSSECISSAHANIRVVVRIRPQNSREHGDNSRVVVEAVDHQMLVFDQEEKVEEFFFRGVQQKGRDFLKKSHKNMHFMFDKVFPPQATTAEVFQETTLSLIDSLMDGRNCSVFAYGATGAGKTYTMTGTQETPGITFLTMKELFKRCEELKTTRDFKLNITYLEVYNELVKDLLKPGAPLNLREDSRFGVMVAGIEVCKIECADDLFRLLEEGNKNRTQHPTDANAESSRSHAVFQVYIQMTIKTSQEIRTAKLSMIDLAGSERGSATNYVGARFTEGANINKSLLALGNCINSLADGLRHVPYRDSKLTRLLKDSLGGNCQTVMIANVSPSSLSYEDTYNTLKYASRAKKIKTTVKRNVVNVELHVSQYVKIVEQLKQENEQLKKQRQEDNEQKQDLQKKYEELKQQLALAQEVEQRVTTNVTEPVNIQPTTTSEILDITQVKSTVDNTYVKNTDVMEKVNELVEEKKKILSRHFHLLKQEVGLVARRILKEELDNRLSDIMTDTNDKEELRSKLNKTIDRFKRQEDAYKDGIDQLAVIMSDIDSQFDSLTEKYPDFRKVIENRKKDLEFTELEHKLELQKETAQVAMRDHGDHLTLLERMASTLKSYYLQLKGHGLLSTNAIKEYDDILTAFKGKKYLTWESNLDSGVSSLTSIDMPVDQVKNTGSKRKIEEDDEPAQQSSPSMDRTFSIAVLSPMPKPVKEAKLCNLNAQQIIAKGGHCLGAIAFELMNGVFCNITFKKN